jgi:hypothetical protein
VLRVLELWDDQRLLVMSAARAAASTRHDRI